MFVLLALHVASSATSAEPPAHAAELIEKWLAENKAPGTSVAAINCSGILWSGGFGLADVQAERPATATTRYQFASITKADTVLLLAQLVAGGEVDLDAPLAQWLPELKSRYPEPGAGPGTAGSHVAEADARRGASDEEAAAGDMEVGRPRTRASGRRQVAAQLSG